MEYVKELIHKSGTPTMGGIAIILAMLTAALIFGKGKFVYITLAVAFAYGVTGFRRLDKNPLQRNLGLRPYQKIILQLSIALIVAFVVYKNELIRGDVYIPLQKKNTVSLGWGVIPLVVFIFIATTNSVNLTDGLDGLAASTTLVYMAGIAAIIAIVAADADKNGLSLYVKRISGAFDGMLCDCRKFGGLLLFNCFPAKIFYGRRRLSRSRRCCGVRIYSRETQSVYTDIGRYVRYKRRFRHNSGCSLQANQAESFFLWRRFIIIYRKKV